MRQANNTCDIIGILSEVDLRTGSFEKDGMSREYIGGSIKVKVAQEISGVMTDLEVPIRMFATKMTKKGTPNPAYNSIKTVMDSFLSIAAAGGEEHADRVRVSGARIGQNEYYAQDGRLVSFPQVTASFVSKIKAEDCVPKATFNAEIFILQMDDELDKEGIPTGRYKVVAALPGYGDRVDVITLIGVTPGVIEGVKAGWEPGQTHKVVGKLNFSSTTKIIKEEVGFGDPIEKTVTSNVSELIITGGSPTPLEGDFAFSNEEIKSALAARKAKLEADKTKERRAASSPKPSNTDFNDLGF